MSLIKKTLLLSIIFFMVFLSKTFASDLKKVGKFKDWEVMVVSEASGEKLNFLPTTRSMFITGVIWPTIGLETAVVRD